MRIDWRMGPAYPLGIQDSALGVVGDTLVSAGGFSRHVKDVLQSCPDAFGGAASGFTNLTFGLDLTDPRASWERLPDLPAALPRQAAATAVADGALYAIGGFSYSEPHTHREVFRLRRAGGAWSWERLPCDTPWPVCEAGAAVLGRRIYLACGFDYFRHGSANGEELHSEAGRGAQPVGRALLALDTERIEAGWQRLADLPGTPRGDARAVACGGRVWVISGVYASLARPATGSPYRNAVDSWVYDPAADRWSRIADAPDGSNRSAVAWRDRWILLVGEYRYPLNQYPDGSTKEVHTEAEKGLDWKAFFSGKVYVYDTRTDAYAPTDPLLETTSYPMVAVRGDEVYSLGGEGGRLWHPDALQVGRVRLG